ncbi:MAG TPA: c-type cytochrome [Burkholderiaceae bacterium]|nr:c-type cytochrome [Burkholderiaceae bacterium]
MSLRADLVLAVGCAMLALVAGAGRAAEPSASAGEAIYLHGVLGSGAPLEAVRPDSGVGTKGADAACVNCHQRSGLGSSEGYLNTYTVPPITGLYLFHARGATSSEPILPYVEWMHGNRDPYNEATLARAIREGLDSQGRPLSYLMPRYPLGDADMAALTNYLRKLDARPTGGVTDTVLHFATIITPDADPARRRAMLEVMHKYFDEKNLFPIGNSRNMRTSGKTEYAKSMFMSHRLWQLHVWDLTGPASAWQAQLEQHLAQEPVFAVVSGLGGSNWVPVHQFCEHESLPCLFPNVDVPVDDDRDFYSLYFSKGVLLEAALIAKAIDAAAKGATVTVQQVYRAGDSGEAAAGALASALKLRGMDVRSHVVAAGAPGRAVAEAVSGASKADALVLWLRPDDLVALGNAASAPPSVFVSGLLGGLEQSPLPQGWRSRARMAYPFDLPEGRSLRLRYPLSWFSIHRIAVVDEEVQANTYLACGLLAETLSHMADNLVRPFLVELLRSKIERRLINTGYFPRMVLGENQHFASKGGYIVHFAEPSGKRLVADSGWVVP